MKKFIKRTLLILLILIVVFGVAGFIYRSTGRQSWRRTTAELQSKGEKLSAADLSAPVATNADEFVAIVTRAAQDVSSPAKDLYFNTLMPFTEVGRVTIAWRVENPTWLEAKGG